jgi:hypothetical protein
MVGGHGDAVAWSAVLALSLAHTNQVADEAAGDRSGEEDRGQNHGGLIGTGVM